MTPRVERSWLPWVATATAVTLLALVVGNLFTLWALDSSAKAARRSRELRDLIDRVQLALTDAETAQRGYLLTAQPAYLEPLRSADEILPPTLAEAMRRAANDPTELKHFGDLSRLAEEKMNELHQTIAMAERGHTDDAIAFVRSGVGKRTMDEARRVMTDLRAREDNELARRAARAMTAVTLAIAIDAIAGLGLFGLGAVLFAINRDIARRETLETALAEAMDLQERFIGVLSHDLRNPLASITLTAGVIERQGPITTKQSAGVARILSSAARMTRMVNQLLDLTRARGGGGLVIHPKPGTDLASVAAEGVDELRVANPGREVRLDTSGDVIGTLDPDGIAQVVSNLVGNALEHGEPPVRCEIAGEGDHIVLEVHNGGEPIPEDLLPHIFEPFKEARGARRSKRRGLGLGLFITKAIVVAHGGTIDVHSSREAGTTFRVVLPRSLE